MRLTAPPGAARSRSRPRGRGGGGQRGSTHCPRDSALGDASSGARRPESRLWPESRLPLLHLLLIPKFEDRHDVPPRNEYLEAVVCPSAAIPACLRPSKDARMVAGVNQRTRHAEGARALTRVQGWVQELTTPVELAKPFRLDHDLDSLILLHLIISLPACSRFVTRAAYLVIRRDRCGRRRYGFGHVTVTPGSLGSRSPARTRPSIRAANARNCSNQVIFPKLKRGRSPPHARLRRLALPLSEPVPRRPLDRIPRLLGDSRNAAAGRQAGLIPTGGAPVLLGQRSTATRTASFDCGDLIRAAIRVPARIGSCT